jgi:hypothetical protein
LRTEIISILLKDEKGEGRSVVAHRPSWAPDTPPACDVH